MIINVTRYTKGQRRLGAEGPKFSPLKIHSLFVELSAPQALSIDALITPIEIQIIKPIQQSFSPNVSKIYFAA